VALTQEQCNLQRAPQHRWQLRERLGQRRREQVADRLERDPGLRQTDASGEDADVTPASFRTGIVPWASLALKGRQRRI
jgi:hypothetical protein